MLACQVVAVARRRRRTVKGFTLLEIMVVLVIIGLVASVTTVAVMDRLKEARIKTTKIEIKVVEEALSLYKLRHNRFPETSQGIQRLVEDKVMAKMPHDGWEHEFHYALEGGRYVITSYGVDEAPGGEDEAADIVVSGE
jgi:general secretion pathway protein G